MSIISKIIGPNGYQQQNSNIIIRNMQQQITPYLNLTLKDIYRKRILL